MTRQLIALYATFCRRINSAGWQALIGGTPHGVGQEPPRKPLEGEACNGCGLCCAVQLCALALEFLADAVAPCPAMEFADGRFWCGLARRPSRYFGTPASSNRLIGPLVHAALNIGEGCDASD